MGTVEPNADQRREMERACAFIREHCPYLVECEGDSKWTEGNILFRFESSKPGMYAYMVGPLKDGRVSWHMMPLYAVDAVKKQVEPALKPFANGKSCIAFRSFDELPMDALESVMREGTPVFQEVMERKSGSGKRR